MIAYIIMCVTSLQTCKEQFGLLEELNMPNNQRDDMFSNYLFLWEELKPAITKIAAVIQQARIEGICYKCKEPWFAGHKKVYKLANQAQTQALQEAMLN